MKTKLGPWIASLGLTAALTAAFVTQAMAQYPPVTGNVVLAAENGTPLVGGQTTVSAIVVDEQGDAVAGLACTFSLSQQPGTDATIEAGPFSTDADGRVSTLLNVGSTAGQIVVEATCGDLGAAVSVVASGASAPAAPPASLPDTGGGGGVDSAWGLTLALIAAVTGAGAIGLALGLRRRKA